MLIRNLPLPIYVLLCIFLSVYLFYMAIKRRNIDRFALRLFYITIAIEGMLCAIFRILRETTIYSTYLNNIDWIILLGVVLIMIVELLYLTITHKGGYKQSKKRIRLGWTLIIISFIASILLFILITYT